MIGSVRKKILNRRQRGLTLAETALALGVAAIIMASLSRMMAETADSLRAKAVADRLNEVVSATKSYVSTNYSALLSQTDAGAPIVIPAGRATATAPVPSAPGGLPSLQGGGFLPSTFIDTNAYGQRHAILVREPVANVLEVLVTTYGGNEIRDSSLIKIQTMIGGHGGVMLSNPIGGTAGQVVGAFGGWRTVPGTWSSSWTGGTTTPTTGHVMATMGFDSHGVLTDYLNRMDIGDPEANRMHANIDMNSRDLQNVNQITANSLSVAGNASVCTANMPGCKLGLGPTADIIMNNDGWARFTGNVAGGGLMIEGAGGNLVVSNGYASISGDTTVGGNAAVAGNATIGGTLGVTGDVTTPDVVLSSLGNQRVSRAVFNAGVYADGDSIPKPSCPSGTTPQVFVMPTQFSDNGAGYVLNGVQGWAVNSGANWIVHLRVRTENGWVVVNPPYGYLTAFTKCT